MFRFLFLHLSIYLYLYVYFLSERVSCGMALRGGLGPGRRYSKQNLIYSKTKKQHKPRLSRNTINLNCVL